MEENKNAKNLQVNSLVSKHTGINLVMMLSFITRAVYFTHYIIEKINTGGICLSSLCNK